MLVADWVGLCFWTNCPLMPDGSSFRGTQELFFLICFDRPFVLSLLCQCRPHEEIWQQPLPLFTTSGALRRQPARTPARPPSSFSTSPKTSVTSTAPLLMWSKWPTASGLNPVFMCFKVIEVSCDIFLQATERSEAVVMVMVSAWLLSSFCSSAVWSVEWCFWLADRRHQWKTKA